MSISREEVARLARLAHLELDAAETDRMARDLGEILAYAGRLPALGAEAAEPVEGGPLRQDRAEEGLSAKEALAPAPERAGDLFRVPPAIEGG